MNISSSMSSGVAPTGMMPPPGPGRGPDPMSEQMHNVMDEVKGDADVREFMGSMREAIESGEFDAAEFAANAPDSLQQIADEQGIDLEEQFSAMADKAQQMKAQGEDGAPPPPPPGRKMVEAFGQNSADGNFALTMESLQFSTTA